MQHDGFTVIVVSATAGALILGLGVVLGMWASYRHSAEARIKRRWKEQGRRPKGRVLRNSPEQIAERAKAEGKKGEYRDPNQDIPGYPGAR